tara:strand:- start:6564 stop:7607 length:1044 start_codon:yes stop_codon:yes gene_type:complete
MKIAIVVSALTLVGSCATTKYTTQIQNIKDSIVLVDSTLVVKYAKTITPNELSKHLYKFSADTFEGRKTGESGQKLAAKYLKSYYISEHIESPISRLNYYQTIPNSFLPKNTKVSENVLAFIKGSEKPDEVVIISAHYDHLGFSNEGKINNGADDNASGTSAIMEIAQAFELAKNNGHSPKRSILFLHLTAEEIGKYGSDYYTQYPIFTLANTVSDLNIDMIGRVDKAHINNKNYIYLIGSDRLSKELHYLSEKVNEAYVNMDLDYRYNVEHEDNHYFERSDQYNFAIQGIPVIFYFNGVHEDYHQPTDTAEKIDYNLLAKRAKLIFATTWQLANQNNRIVIDKLTN